MDGVTFVTMVGSSVTVVISIYKTFSNKVDELKEELSKVREDIAAIKTDIQWLKRLKKGKINEYERYQG